MRRRRSGGGGGKNQGLAKFKAISQSARITPSFISGAKKCRGQPRREWHPVAMYLFRPFLHRLDSQNPFLLRKSLEVKGTIFCDPEPFAGKFRSPHKDESKGVRLRGWTLHEIRRVWGTPLRDSSSWCRFSILKHSLDPELLSFEIQALGSACRTLPKGECKARQDTPGPSTMGCYWVHTHLCPLDRAAASST